MGQRDQVLSWSGTHMASPGLEEVDYIFTIIKDGIIFRKKVLERQKEEMFLTELLIEYLLHPNNLQYNDY